MTEALQYGHVEIATCLYLAGGDPNVVRKIQTQATIMDEVIDIPQDLMDKASNPLSLTILCRQVIRSALAHTNLYQLPSLQLPLPKYLRSFLYFSDFKNCTCGMW